MSVNAAVDTVESVRKRICIQLCVRLEIKEKGDWGLFQAICFMCETFLQINQHIKWQKSNFYTDFYKNNYFE